MASQGAHFSEVRLAKVFGLVRMDSDRGVNPILWFRNRQRRTEFVGSGASADRQQVTQAGRAGARDDGITVRVKLGIVQVGVGVNQHKSLAAAP
jgi:hypothetical protein